MHLGEPGPCRIEAKRKHWKINGKSTKNPEFEFPKTHTPAVTTGVTTSARFTMLQDYKQWVNARLLRQEARYGARNVRARVELPHPREVCPFTFRWVDTRPRGCTVREVDDERLSRGFLSLNTSPIGFSSPIMLCSNELLGSNNKEVRKNNKKVGSTDKRLKYITSVKYDPVEYSELLIDFSLFKYSHDFRYLRNVLNQLTILNALTRPPPLPGRAGAARRAVSGQRTKSWHRGDYGTPLDTGHLTGITDVISCRIDGYKSPGTLHIYNLFSFSTTRAHTRRGSFKQFAPSNPPTIAWAIMVVSSLCIALGLLKGTLNFFAEHFVLSVIETTHNGIWNYPFPAITVCDINRVSLNLTQKFVENLTLPPAVTKEFVAQEMRLLNELLYPGIYGSHVRNNLSQLQNIFDMNKLSIPAIMNSVRRELPLLIKCHKKKIQFQVAQSCQNFLVSCKWKSKTKSCSSIFRSSISRDGVCCSFNYITYDLIMEEPK
ncbi:hypothetical protein WN51_06033 [Melipona quadrifasciata]|uniref:Sodium channel protein Nach n=1 Tax=Melipona quadrifasciata TaxID=166423 RepID=A0A0M8ZRV6_9HYME|nr:hypothetical protein WN51_06033 [Melipona quadrifasciata]